MQTLCWTISTCNCLITNHKLRRKVQNKMPREQIMLFSCWMMWHVLRGLACCAPVLRHTRTMTTPNQTRTISSVVSVSRSFWKTPGNLKRGALVDMLYKTSLFPRVCFTKGIYTHTPCHVIPSLQQSHEPMLLLSPLTDGETGSGWSPRPKSRSGWVET